MLLEVIATNAADVKIAAESGADRVELITGILEGGLTPSYGLIEQAVRVGRIPIYVMVRPHSHSFHYSNDDVQTMLSDIRAIKQLGASGIVIGALTEEKQIDLKTLEVLLREADGLDVTFHRAFDAVSDQSAALTLLQRYPQINRILTSGGKPSALDAVERIRELIQRTAGTNLTILAGSGLQVNSLADFVAKTGVKEVHFGTGVRRNGAALELLDPAKIRQVKKCLNR